MFIQRPLTSFFEMEEDECSQSSGVDEELWSESDSELEAHLHAKGEFFGCYLLVSRNPSPKFKGHTYIGFTVDPNRRVKQHNCGHHKGGARKTSGKGPWDMVLIVHGFPNHIAALQFEWAWQNPARSRHLGVGVARKKRTESHFEYRFRVLTEMLSVGPWWRLPLTIRWLRQEYQLQFPPDKQPPLHMPIAYGLVGLCKNKLDSSQHALSQPQPSGGVAGGGASEKPAGVELDERNFCQLCEKQTAEVKLVRCYQKDCTLVAHVTCLAPRLCETAPRGRGEGGGGKETDHLIPVCGQCPRCGQELLWGELVRRLKVREKEPDGKSAPPPTATNTQRRKRKALPSSQPARVQKKRCAGVSSGAASSHWTETLHVQQ